MNDTTQAPSSDRMNEILSKVAQGDGQQTQEPKKEEDKPKTDFSKSFAALAAKERKIREREMAWKQERDQIKPKVDEFEKINGLRERTRTKDPQAIKEALSILGISASDVSELALRDPEIQKDPETLKILETLETYKTKIEELEKYKNDKLEEEKNKELEKNHSSAIESLKKDTLKIVEENPDKFDLCKCLGDDLLDMVLEIGDSHYERTKSENGDGEILSLEKILEMIETKEEQRLAKLRASKKFGTQAAPSDASKTGTTPPTLTNKTIATGNHVELSGLTGDARMNAILQKYAKK